MSGIYQIYNPINNKRYVWSSIDIENRFKQHIRKLKINKHCNCHLQNAWNKYGDQLQFLILEYCEPDQLIETEQYYIDYYNSANREFGYNIDKCVSHFGHSLSEETKEKIRQKAIGRKQSKEAIEKTRLANLGQKRPRQSQIMKEKYKNGYTIPRFTDMSLEKQKIWRENLSKSTKERFKDLKNRPKGCFLKAIFDDGTVCFYPSYHEASKHNDIDRGAIKYAFCCKNGRVDKIKCTFYKISEEEFFKNKVSGEK